MIPDFVRIGEPVAVAARVRRGEISSSDCA